MQQPKRLIIAGVIVFILGLTILFPARTAYHWLAPQQFRISGISGSMWHGKATEGMAGNIYLRNLSWDLRPLALFGGKLMLAVSADSVMGSLDAEIAVTPSAALFLSNINGTLSLQTFKDFFQLQGFRGNLNLQIAELVIRDGIPVRATGSVSLAGLAAPQLSDEPIGDFRVVLQTDDSGIVGSVEDLSGVLRVAGVIRLGLDRTYSFIGQVAATPQTPANIRQQLQLLGSADERGQREFRIEGQL